MLSEPIKIKIGTTGCIVLMSLAGVGLITIIKNIFWLLSQ